MKNHSFPKTYTTAGAVYRAKKIYTERFPEQTFSVVKQDGNYILNSVVTEVKQGEVTNTKPKKAKVVVTDFDGEPSFDEVDGLFDDDDGTLYDVFPEDGWDD